MKPFVMAAGLVVFCSISGCSQRQAGTVREGVAADDWRRFETRVNTFTHNRQTAPTLATTPDGGYVAVWGSRRQEVGTYGVFAQRLDAFGRHVGSEVHVNQSLPGMQQDPAVAVTDDGVAWIVWTSTQQDGSEGAIVARRFALSGEALTPISDEFMVNEQAAGDQQSPVIAVHAAHAAIAWVTPDPDADFTRIATRLYTHDGAPATGERRLEHSPAGRQAQVNIAARPADFVLAWSQSDSRNQPTAVLTTVLTPAGDRVPVRLSPRSGMHIEPSVDAWSDGRFVVAWLQRHAGDAAYTPVARLCNADGALSDLITTTAGDGWRSGVHTTTAGDGFVVAWNVDENVTPPQNSKRWAPPADIWAQWFDATGVATGAPQRVNAQQAGRQTLDIAPSGRQLTVTDQGKLAAIWTGETGRDDRRGIALTVLAPSDMQAPAAPAHARRAGAADVTGLDVYPLIPPVIDLEYNEKTVFADKTPAGPDFGFDGIDNTGWTPPDPDIAAGPNHLVLVVNGEIRFRELDGTTTFDQPIAGSAGFWGAQGATGFVFDPVALFDTHANRFVVAAAELNDDRSRSWINIAVSDDDNPNGAWAKYRFELSSFGGFFDFPNLGVDEDAIYIAGDFFTAPRGNFVFIFDKAPMLVGGPVTPVGVRTGSNPRSLGAVKHYDTALPAGYFAQAIGGTTLTLNAIEDPLGSATLRSFTLNVPFYSFPPGAEQLGTSNRADAIDNRIKNGVYRNGSLWLVHSVASQGVTRVRWYEVRMNGWPASGNVPELRQTGLIDEGPGIYTWMADIHVDDVGNAVICFNRSSANEFISVQRAVRGASDPLGQFAPGVVLQESTSPETGDRWGDYAGVDEQPNAPGVLWTHNAYRTSAWRTWVGQIIVDATLIDCNGNDVADAIDIFDGTSTDCNGNDIPDECDITSGASLDCDGNGVPDECDPDCNADGVPDVCQLDGRDGLAGAYFATLDLSSDATGRVDPTIDLVLGLQEPLPLFPADGFSVRWTGYLQTQSAGWYEFALTTDGVVRLLVDGDVVIDADAAGTIQEFTGSTTLPATRDVYVVLEYQHNVGNALVQWRWTPPGGVRALVPATSLRPGFDCNGNMRLDRCDIAEGLLVDSDANGFADRCEADCDGNGVLDFMDISSGAATDCNNDAKPDACNLIDGDATDCDGDNVLDVCQLLGNDCDDDGVLDACALASGLAPDCNNNGLPDACDVRPVGPFIVNETPAVIGWVELADGVGTPLGLDNSDTFDTTLPFANNRFAGLMRISADGALGFNTVGAISSANTPIPSSGLFTGAQALLPLWDNLGLGGEVYLATVGDAPERIVVVQWQDVGHNPAGANPNANDATFQVQLFEQPIANLYAQMLYRDVTFGDPAFDNGASATIGYQADGTFGVQWSFNEAGAVEGGAPFGSVLSLGFSAEGGADDVNENGVPDDCEDIDCNDNGVFDPLEVRDGLVADCNGNFIPDSCDIDAGIPDLNKNGVPDSCDDPPLGDMNCDRVVNAGDIDGFVLAVLDTARYIRENPDCDAFLADCDGSGLINVADIDCFVEAIVNGGQ